MLNSEKIVGINAANADWYVVLAGEETSGETSAFLLPADVAGIECGEQLAKLGRRCCDLCSLQLHDVELKAENIIGPAGQGSALMRESTCLSAPVIAAHAVGLIKSALEHSLRYSKERQTFGQPIGKHQAVAFMIADMAKDMECARLLTWKAASLFDGHNHDPFIALSARLFAVDAAMTAATDAVQIFGAYGYSREYPVERLMRDAKMMQIMPGSSFELKCAIGEELLNSLFKTEF